MKGLDNVLMWDLRDRVPQWKKKKLRKQAIKAGQEYTDPGRVQNLTWRVHTPFESWVHVKELKTFKGQGSALPWTSDPEAVVTALTRFILDCSDRWTPPPQIPRSNQAKILDMLLTRVRYRISAPPAKTPEPRPNKQPQPMALRGNLVSVVTGRYIDTEWITSHLDTYQRKRAYNATAEWRDEEEEWNTVSPPGSIMTYNQREYNQFMLPGILRRMVTEGKIDGLLRDLEKNWGAR
jgi:hypothetical protein